MEANGYICIWMPNHLIRTKSFVDVGKWYGVSDNAVRKWCDSEGLPKRKKDIKKYTDEEWNRL